jgi:hypothetical protein
MSKVLIVGSAPLGLALAALLLSHGHEAEHVDAPELEKVVERQIPVLPVVPEVPDMRWAEVFTGQARHRYNRPAHRKARNNWK